MIRDAKYWIDKLQLIPHPEGGMYKEIYRSENKIKGVHLPSIFTGDRHICTSIYYLLNRGEFSAFHRIRSDEIWHFYDGDPVIIYSINSNGVLKKFKLGLSHESEVSPQLTIPAGSWFASHSTGEFSLVGCTVAPGFDFDDFELAERKTLAEEFPGHVSLINRFTRM